jgi:hypothetical protein
MDVGTIFLRDANSKINKEMIEYLKCNLEQIIMKAGITFKYRIIGLNDKSSKHPGRFPALVMQGNDPIIGIPDIKKFLHSQMVSSRKAPAQVKSDEENLQDMMMSFMTEGVQVTKGAKGNQLVVAPENEPDMSGGGDLVQRATLAARSRKMEGLDAMGGGLGGREGMQSRGPSRTSLMNNDYEDRAPPRRSNNLASRGNPVPVSDEPLSVLKSMQGRNRSMEEQRDDELLGKILFNNTSQTPGTT